MQRLIRPPEVKADFVGALQGWLRSMLGISSAHGAAIADLETRISTGASFSDKFNRPDSATLENGWIQGGAGQPLGIEDNAARLNGLGIATGVRYAICPAVMTDNNHSVAAIVNPHGIAAAAKTSLYVRANADLTEFVYLNVFRDVMYLGRGTRSGTTWTHTDWRVIPTGVSEADTVELVADGTTYQVIVNRAVIERYPDTSGYPVDASHRTVGFSQETRIVGLIPQYSFGLAGFSARSGLGTLASTTAVATTAQATATAAQSTATAAQSTANSKPSYADVPTDVPLWVNINANDDPTFPLSALVMWTNDTDGGAGTESIYPDYVPATRVLELGHIRATRDRNYSTIGCITGATSWGLAPQSFEMFLFKMSLLNGNLTKLWSSGDIKSSIAAAGTQFRVTMPTIGALKGEVYAVGVHQISPNPAYANRPLACLKSARPDQPSGVYPRNIYGWVAASDTVPATILASNIQTNAVIPWLVLG
ncbi:hypothetical protein [Nocardia bovistercoris]|uniref:Minor tail protein n=1 Tax=Nocardia bovistercoris TaxID=2785916 RepID=A0A931IE46_9NOCA|nr:hypothetical protein [Nocardia bovistercoris]MBH0778831.1 hypothetical protein [Nocardia bovistercoris]